MKKLKTLSDTRFKTLKAWLKYATARAIQAGINDSWKGGGDPRTAKEWIEALHELKSALASVDDVLDRDLKAPT